MISEAGKKYIAQNFGVGNCWVYSGLSWRAHGIDGTHVDGAGGTGSIVSRVISGAIERVELKTPRTGSFTKAQLTAANAGEVTLIDIRDVILANDGYPTGQAKYCAEPEELHKIVKIVPPTEQKEAYVSDIEIPGEMIIGQSYSGAVMVSVNTTGEYKAEIIFYAHPTGWDGQIASLPSATSTIATEVKALSTGSQRLNWTWTVPNMPGDFVIISRLYVI